MSGFTRKNHGNSHSYYLDGVKVPGVTSIIGVLDKPALVNWAATSVAEHAINNWERLSGMPLVNRYEELKQAHRLKNKEAIVRGKRIHALAERISVGEAVDPQDASLVAAARAYADLLDAWELEPVILEASVLNRDYLYAGTLDGVFTSPRLGTIIADIKGLALDTPIPTPSGWTTMGEVKVGDQVFGANGSPCNVTLKSQVKRIGTYVVRFDDGSEIVCDSEHIWWTQGSREAAPSAKHISEVIATMTRYGQKNHRVPVAGALDLPDADLPIEPYVLGCWLGDGHRNGGTITKGRDLFEVLESDGHRLGVEQPCHSGQVVTRTVLGLRSDLIEAELIGQKKIPDEYLRASRTQRLRLLQGLMDTDGTWNTARDRAAFMTTDEALAKQVFELLATLGQRPHLKSVQRTGFGLTVTSYDVEWTPVGIEPFRLPRKAAKVTPKRVPYVATRRVIVSIEPGPDVETACIGVDSWNHTYLCGEAMIPTHNTGKRAFSEVALQLAAYRNADVYLEERPRTGPRGGKLPSDWVERPMPSVDGAVVIHIERETDDSPAVAHLQPVQAGPDIFEQFLYLREVFAGWVERTGYDHRKSESYNPPVGAPLYPEQPDDEIREAIQS